MLQTETVHPKTLELLKQINDLDYFKRFALAGGTALALQIGHRMSYDLDFFGKKEIESIEILNGVSKFAVPKIIHQTQNILILNANDIKIDFVNYNYPLLKPLLVKDGLRLFSIEDIAAMKLSAIAGRGKKRDFVDLYFILQQFSMEELLSFYSNKYKDGSLFLVLKSLTYFDDADLDSELKLLKKASWNDVKSYIIKETEKIN